MNGVKPKVWRGGRIPTPSEIVARLDAVVVGQASAKRALAVCAYAHARKAQSGESFARSKSNAMVIGPTGSGKTLICETLARLLGVPWASADAASLAQSRYPSDELMGVAQRLLESAGGDEELAGMGMVFVDEVDKLGSAPGHARPEGGTRAQHALLKAMEGTTLRALDGKGSVDTTGVLFVFGGAFVELEARLKANPSFKHLSICGEASAERITEKLNAKVKPTDLFDFGLIPEFVGRIPVVSRLDRLTEADLRRILVDPEDALAKEFGRVFEREGAKLTVEAMALSEVAGLAMELNIGARGLRGVFEEMVSPALFELPDKKGVSEVIFRSIYEDPVFVQG